MMEDRLLNIFLKVRESFSEIKDIVSLIKPYFELICFSTAWALRIEEFERILGFKPEYVYKSLSEKYAISVQYRVDDVLTTGMVAHEFAKILARENDIFDNSLIDKICVEKGFGEELLYALEDDAISDVLERDLIERLDIDERITNLKKLLGHCCPK
jgi:hypothetical protein